MAIIQSRQVRAYVEWTGGGLARFNAGKYVTSVSVHWLQWGKISAWLRFLVIWTGEISDSQHMKSHKNEDSDIKQNIDYLVINPFDLDYNIFCT